MSHSKSSNSAAGTGGKNYEIRTGRIEIELRREGITFVAPAKGPESYFDLQRSISREGLKWPSIGDISTLVGNADTYREEPVFGGVLSLVETKSVLGFTGLLFVPPGKGDIQNGVAICDAAPSREGKLYMNKLELIHRLETHDKDARFVPFGFKTGKQSASELAKNPFVIGLFGSERTEALVKFSEKFGSDPGVWCPDNVDGELARVACLGGKYDGKGLNIRAYCHDTGKSFYSFGMYERKNSKG